VRPGLAAGLEDAVAEERPVRHLHVGALAEVQRRHAEAEVPDHVRPAGVQEHHAADRVGEDRTCTQLMEALLACNHHHHSLINWSLMHAWRKHKTILHDHGLRLM
jgi:hypothetical protein